MKMTTKLFAALAMVSVPAIAAAQVDIGSIGNQDGLTIEGTVADVFGNKFVLEDETGRVLVETGPSWFHNIAVTQGERLTVVGEPDGDGFDAFRITRQDGTEIVVRDPNGPAPWAGGPRANGDDRRAERHERHERRDERRAEREERREERRAERGPRGEHRAEMRAENEQAARAALEGFGFTEIELDERGPRHFEFDARDADGRLVEVRIDADGIVTKLEVETERPAAQADFAQLLPEPVRQALARDNVTDIREFERERRHYEVEGFNGDGQEVEMDIRLDGQVTKVEIKGERSAAAVPAPSEAQLRQVVEAGGYEWVGNVEAKPRHHEVIAVNSYGETVELHVDFGGEIYKERLQRQR